VAGKARKKSSGSVKVRMWNGGAAVVATAEAAAAVARRESAKRALRSPMQPHRRPVRAVADPALLSRVYARVFLRQPRRRP
jgi:hypothetical protein